jgi:hypothetical protein
VKNYRIVDADQELKGAAPGAGSGAQMAPAPAPTPTPKTPPVAPKQ